MKHRIKFNPNTLLFEKNEEASPNDICKNPLSSALNKPDDKTETNIDETIDNKTKPDPLTKKDGINISLALFALLALIVAFYAANSANRISQGTLDEMRQQRENSIRPFIVMNPTVVSVSRATVEAIGHRTGYTRGIFSYQSDVFVSAISIGLEIMNAGVNVASSITVRFELEDYYNWLHDIRELLEGIDVTAIRNQDDEVFFNFGEVYANRSSFERLYRPFLYYSFENERGDKPSRVIVGFMGYIIGEAATSMENEILFLLPKAESSHNIILPNHYATLISEIFMTLDGFAEVPSIKIHISFYDVDGTFHDVVRWLRVQRLSWEWNAITGERVTYRISMHSEP